LALFRTFVLCPTTLGPRPTRRSRELGSFCTIGPPESRRQGVGLSESAIRNPQSAIDGLGLFGAMSAREGPVSEVPRPVPTRARIGRLGSFCIIGPSLARHSPDVPSCPSLALFCRGLSNVIFTITPFLQRTYPSFCPEENWLCLAPSYPVGAWRPPAPLAGHRGQIGFVFRICPLLAPPAIGFVCTTASAQRRGRRARGRGRDTRHRLELALFRIFHRHRPGAARARPDWVCFPPHTSCLAQRCRDAGAQRVSILPFSAPPRPRASRSWRGRPQPVVPIGYV
jgi:hypothetical protein